MILNSKNILVNGAIVGNDQCCLASFFKNGVNYATSASININGIIASLIHIALHAILSSSEAKKVSADKRDLISNLETRTYTTFLPSHKHSWIDERVIAINDRLSSIRNF